MECWGLCWMVGWGCYGGGGFDFRVLIECFGRSRGKHDGRGELGSGAFNALWWVGGRGEFDPKPFCEGVS